MGWTEYRAKNYRRQGNKLVVDRKAECDEIFTWEENGEKRLEVLKSAMVGSTYYAAVRVREPKVDEVKVIGAVCITSTNARRYLNFGYKDMSENMGPYKYDCPKAILDLLTPTDNEYAIEWREKCRQKLAERKTKPSLSSLPVGTEIEFTLGDGRVIRLKKHCAAYQFKRPFWWDGEYHFSTKYIPDSYTVIRKGA